MTTIEANITTIRPGPELDRSQENGHQHPEDARCHQREYVQAVLRGTGRRFLLARYPPLLRRMPRRWDVGVDLRRNDIPSCDDVCVPCRNRVPCM
jgi:hypothetical protein